MHITALCVSVGYADLFSKSIAAWKNGVDKLIVVTAPTDTATRNLCKNAGLEPHVTNIFYANGAAFNKAAAMAEAAAVHNIVSPQSDWLLTFDADIVPPPNWRKTLEAAKPRRGKLYGTYRYQQPENIAKPVLNLRRRMPQGWVIGFFILFHANDPMTPRPPEPLFDLCWGHAGVFDTIFTRRWRKEDQVLLADPKMIHLGEERKNWCGRHPQGQAQLRQMLGRRRKAEDWNHERMPNPPTIGNHGHETK